MVRAEYDGVVIAESDGVRVIEGMAYFPIADVDADRLLPSPTTSWCFWKGKASYWHVCGESDVAPDAAFRYEHPWPLARRLVGGRIAFWRAVRIVET